MSITISSISSTPHRAAPHLSKAKIPIAQSRLQEIKKNFDENINDIKDKFVIIDVLLSGTPMQQEIDGAEALLRAQVVFLESAFDYYLHQLFEYGMIMMFNDSWERTEYYNKRQISMTDVDYLFENFQSTRWFNQHIYKKNSKSLLSNTEIGGILNAFSLSEESIANTAGYKGNDSKEIIKNMYEDLSKVLQRRNEIAHCCDIVKGNKQLINKQQVEKYISIIENIVIAIHQEASNK